MIWSPGRQLTPPAATACSGGGEAVQAAVAAARRIKGVSVFMTFSFAADFHALA